MKNLISVLIVALSICSCSPSSDSGLENCGDTKNVIYESYRSCNALKENPTKPSYLIVNTKEEFQKIFSTCTGDNSTIPDFEQKKLMGLFSGPKPSGGYEIKIQSVVENDCQLIVEYFEREPKPEDMVTMAISYPTDYVLIPKSNKPIVFQKVKELEYVVIGSYYGECIGADCLDFYKIDVQKVIRYSNVNYNSYDFNQYNYKVLNKTFDYASFAKLIPAEIISLKGQSKTYGSPDSHDQGGVYFEFHQGKEATKIYLDTENTTDQSKEVIGFKKLIQDKITALKLPN